MTFVAQQIQVSPTASTPYGARSHTRTTHRQQVQAYLGFRLALPLDLAALEAW